MALGGSSVRTISLSNRGGHVIEGDFSVDLPWKVEPEHYHMGRRETAEFRIVFIPNTEQEFRGAIRYPGFPRETLLRATAYAPLVAMPREVVLMAVTAGGTRIGSVTLTNRTGSAMAVKISGDPRLHLPQEVTVPAGGFTNVPASLAASDLAAIDTPVEFRSAAAVQTVSLHAGAVTPPATGLRIEPRTLDFGRTEVGRPRELRLRIVNQNNARAEITADVPPPFQVENPSFSIEPGAAFELPVQIRPAWPGRLSAVMRLRGTEIDLRIPLSADMTPRATASGSGAALGGDSRVTVQTNGSAILPKLPKYWSGIPPIGAITIDRLSAGTVDLSWAPPGKATVNDTLKYRIEVRRFGMDPTGTLQVAWIPVTGVDYVKKPDRVKARLDGVPPGIGITMRVVSITPRGSESEPSMPFQFFVPEKPVIFTLQRVLLGFFALLLIGALWIRSQMALPMRNE